MNTAGLISIHESYYLKAEKLFASLTSQKKMQAMSMWKEETQTGPSYEKEGDLAIIRVSGPLYECEPWMEFFGVCSYQRIRKQMFEANLDPNVRGIKLLINSPGGSVDGCFETQKVLSAYKTSPGGDVQAKPVVEAEIQTIGASAAYLLAATAQTIKCSAHSTVGSIGTILTYYGDKGFLAKLGITRTTLVSSVSPFKNDDPEDVGDEGRQRLQKWVDTLGQVFVSTVASLRGVPVETVLSNYGKGGVFVGQDALSAGLVDALTDLPSAQEGEDMSETTTTTTTTTTDEDQNQEAAESTMIEEEAADKAESPDAVAKELDRLKAIDDLKITGYDDLVYKAKYQDKVSAETLKAWVFDAQRTRKAGKLDAMKAAEANQKSIATVDAEKEAIRENEKLIEMARQEKKHRG